jgi:hypothetical protein
MSEAKVRLIPYLLDFIGTAVSWNSEQSPKIRTMSKVFKSLHMSIHLPFDGAVC